MRIFTSPSPDSGKNDEKYRNIVINAPIAIYEIAFDGQKLRYVNPAVSQWSGYSEEELLTMNPLELLADESKKKFQEIVIEAMKGQKTFFSAEFEIRKKNGQSIWGLFHAKVNCKNGKPDSVQVFVQDITERKKTEEALQLSQEKYLKAFEGSPFAVTLTRLSDGAVAEVNDAGLKLFGFDRTEIIGKTSLELRTWANSNDRNVLAKELSAKGSFHNQEVTLLKKDGTHFDVVMSSAIILISAEKYWLASFVDITEHKKIEATCKESEERLKGLVESTSDWIWQVDQNAVYTYSSPKVKEILGYESEEVVGKTPFDLMPKDQVDEMSKIFAEAAKNKCHLLNLENLAVHKNGKIVVLETSGVPIEDEKGNLVGYRGIDRDITERKKVEQALRESEQLYRTLFDNSDEGFMVVEPIYDERGFACDIRFLKFNAAYERQTGTKGADALGRKASDIVPELEPTIISLSGKVAKTGKSTHSETYDKYSNRWYDSHYIPFAKGQVGLLFRDITERKKAEETLAAREKEYRQLVEQAPTAIYEIDFTGPRFKNVNDAMCLISGYTREELLALNPFAILAPESQETFKQRISKALAGEKIDQNIEYKAVTKDGRKLWVTLNLKLMNKDGRYYGAQVIAHNITEIKKTQESLRTEKERYRNLADSLPEIVFETDINGNLLFANARGFEITGYSNEDFDKGFDVFNLVAPEDKKKVIDDFKKTLNNQPTPYNEFTIVRKDGSTFPAIIIANSIVKEGQPTGLRGLVIDITERKKTEEEKKQTEEKLQKIIDQSPVVFELYDKSGFQVQVNPAWDKLWGVPREFTLGKYNILKSEQVIKNGWIPYIKRAYAGEIVKVPDLEYDASLDPSTKGLGRKRWLSTIIYPLKDKNGEVTNIAILHEDITEQKNTQKALTESEMRYRQLFSSMTETFFVAELLHDKHGKVVDFVYCEANPEYVQSLGKTSEQVIGKRAKELFGGVGIEEHWLEELDRITKTGKLFRGEQFSKRTGKFYEVHAWRVSDNRAGIITYDVTQQKALEKQLQDNERMAAIGQTAAMIGHDIRNPLQAIISELYLTKEDIAQAPESKHKQESLESVNFVEEQINYINKIVSDLQDFARPLNPEYSIVNLSDLLVSIFDGIVLSDKIKLKIDVQGTLKLKTDPTFIRRAITNLANNAIQAMPEGGELRLAAQKKEERVVMAVSDTGQGIPEHVKANLFKPLTTTKSKGQGLGLAVVKRLIEALNGKVSFESEEGKGTKFTIELPIAH